MSCTWHTFAFVSDELSFQLKDFQDVIYTANSYALELNCTVNWTLKKTTSKHFLAWKHNNTLIPSCFTRTIDNSTLQLRRNHTQFADTGVYICGVFSNFSKFPIVTFHQVRVIIGGMYYKIWICTVQLYLTLQLYLFNESECSQPLYYNSWHFILVLQPQ